MQDCLEAIFHPRGATVIRLNSSSDKHFDKVSRSPNLWQNRQIQNTVFNKSLNFEGAPVQQHPDAVFMVVFEENGVEQVKFVLSYECDGTDKGAPPGALGAAVLPGVTQPTIEKVALKMWQGAELARPFMDNPAMPTFTVRSNFVGWLVRNANTRRELRGDDEANVAWTVKTLQILWRRHMRSCIEMLHYMTRHRDSILIEKIETGPDRPAWYAAGMRFDIHLFIGCFTFRAQDIEDTLTPGMLYDDWLGYAPAVAQRPAYPINSMNRVDFVFRACVRNVVANLDAICIPRWNIDDVIRDIQGPAPPPALQNMPSLTAFRSLIMRPNITQQQLNVMMDMGQFVTDPVGLVAAQSLIQLRNLLNWPGNRPPALLRLRNFTKLLSCLLTLMTYRICRTIEIRWTTPHANVNLTAKISKFRELLNQQRMDNIRSFAPLPAVCVQNNDMHFRRWDPAGNVLSLNLMQMCCVKMHEYAPPLHPPFEAQIEAFNIPSAKLFLRTIGCFNMVSLQTLARRLKRHSTDAAAQCPASVTQFNDVLSTFPIAIQEDIRQMIDILSEDPSPMYTALVQ